MATTIHAEVSQKNPYWIPKHRYYELKHFCLQYPSWKAVLYSLDGLGERQVTELVQRTGISNPTERYGIARASISKRMDLVEKAVSETDPLLGNYILTGVTEGCSYDQLNARDRVPCNREYYYILYRKFFWILDKKRD